MVHAGSSQPARPAACAGGHPTGTAPVAVRNPAGGATEATEESGGRLPGLTDSPAGGDDVAVNCPRRPARGDSGERESSDGTRFLAGVDQRRHLHPNAGAPCLLPKRPVLPASAPRQRSRPASALRPRSVDGGSPAALSQTGEMLTTAQGLRMPTTDHSLKVGDARSDACSRTSTCGRRSPTSTTSGSPSASYMLGGRLLTGCSRRTATPAR